MKGEAGRQRRSGNLSHGHEILPDCLGCNSHNTHTLFLVFIQHRQSLGKIIRGGAHPRVFIPSLPGIIIIYTELHESALPKGGSSHFLIQDQNKEERHPGRAKSWGQIFSFQPFHALTPGFLPEDSQWEGGREEEKGARWAASLAPAATRLYLMLVGKWSRLTGSVRETAMMMEDNRRKETEGKKVISA